MKVTIRKESWAKYNPRNDAKNFSWFRFQNNFFEDPAIEELPPKQKLLLVYLFTRRNMEGSDVFDVSLAQVARRLHGVSPPPPELLRSVEEDLRGLAAANLIGLPPETSDVPESTSTYVDVPESTSTDLEVLYERTDERTDERDERNEQDGTGQKSPSRAAALFGAWNENRGGLPRALKLTKARTDKIRARLKEEPSLEAWIEVFRKAAASDFLSGRNDRGWKVDFDWLIENGKNWVKVAEGRYDNPDAGAGERDPYEWMKFLSAEERARLEAHEKKREAAHGQS